MAFAVVENIVMGEVILFRTCSLGINPYPAGEREVADPDRDFVNCGSL
jgi:hypothetical protein